MCTGGSKPAQKDTYIAFRCVPTDVDVFGVGFASLWLIALAMRPTLHKPQDQHRMRNTNIAKYVLALCCAAAGVPP